MTSRASRLVSRLSPLARPGLRLAVAASLSVAALVAQAQSAPPIKPGLWEMKMSRETDGKQAPGLSEHMKDMSPEMRARMEAMMKQRGVSMDGGNTTAKVCLTKESLAKDGWRDQQREGCKTDVSGQGTGTWKWHSVCPDMVSDGEASFPNGDSYSFKNTMVMTRNGQQHVTKMTGTAKRLGDDCGDLKPMRR